MKCQFDLLEGLNDDQRAAVTSTAPVILCLAGAGTGKTKTLTHRIARLYQDGVQPENILALTFTRLAGMEMKDRLIRLIGEPGRKVFMNTFHAFAVSVLRDYGHLIGIEPNFSIYDQEDRESILEQIIRDFGERTKLKKVLERFECSEDIDVAETYTCFPEECKVLKEYGYRLRQNNAVDLDRLIDLVNKLWTDNLDVLENFQYKYRFVFVDEFQDTNNEQMRLLELLHPENIFFVGDDYQAIYGWRGAKVEFLIDLPKYRPDCEIIKLEENYRSTRPIVTAANNVIAHNTRQTKKELRAQRDGRKVEIFDYPDPTAEAGCIAGLVKQIKIIGNIPLCAVAVLARTNAQIDLVKSIFDMNGLAAQVVSNSDDVFKRPDIRALMSWLYVVSNTQDDVNLKKALMFPKQYVTPMELDRIVLAALDDGLSLFETVSMYRSYDGAKEFLEKFIEIDFVPKKQATPSYYFGRLIEVLEIEEHYFSAGNTNRWDDVNWVIYEMEKWEITRQNAGESYDLQSFLKWLRYRDIQEKLVTINQNAVKLMTVHAAKGLEFHTVIVAGLNEGKFPSKKTTDMEEERRLFYVAVTRAKENLFVTCPRAVLDWNGKLKSAEPSRFIQEMGVLV
jgi:DNA helicase-2/ATP-dependent DNA helicase PcrA